jgi:hypothetical protein
MSRTFKVWNPGEGEAEQDGDTFAGDGASDAAELWAEDTDERDSEFPIATGQTPTVHVRHMDGPERGKIERFKVTGEFTATYTARSLDEPDPEQA